jgi:hypothetical protein
MGDKLENVTRQIEAAHMLMDYGYVPVTPLIIGHYMEQLRERPYDEWMEACFTWLWRCDALLRLEGESYGADAEVAEASRMGIPIVFSIEELSRVVGQ